LLKKIMYPLFTHIGDARETNMSRSGMVNISQLARE